MAYNGDISISIIILVSPIIFHNCNTQNENTSQNF